MKQKENLEKALALIISCTRRVKRPLDIVTLAKNISDVKGHLGSLEAVGQAVDLSVQQLKDFLEVEGLCTEVKALVKKRAIDSVDVMKNISRLPKESQQILAKELAKGTISSKDIRIITSFTKQFPDKSIRKTLRDYYKSRDIKTYLVKFPAPKDELIKEVQRKFEKIVGETGIVSFKVNNGMATLELSYQGQKKIREAAKKKKNTLRKFVNCLLAE